MRRNKGISLIVLVITIIVMIILAGSIIITLSNSGIINKANEAVEMSNEAQLKEMATAELIINGWYSGQDFSAAQVEALKKQFGEQGVNQLRKDTLVLSKDGTTITLYSTGDMVKGEVELWDGESSVPEIKEGKWYIYKASELKFLADFVNNGGTLTETQKTTVANVGYNEANYKILDTTEIHLMADLDLGGRKTANGHEGTQWTPIGITKELKFIGIFEGNNHTICGVYVSKDKFAGIFGQSDTIKNLTVKDSYIETTSGGGAGGIVAIFNEGTIENCHNINTQVVGATYNVGGIVGYFNGTNIKDCSNTGKIQGNIGANDSGASGGIVGNTISTGVVVENCINYGSVSSNGKNVGGIVGTLSTSGIIKNSINNGNVLGNYKGELASVGGIVGYTYNYVTVSGCVNNGKVTSYGERTGGIIGCTQVGTKINNCINTSQIESTAIIIGGISGCFLGTMEKCYNIGNVKVKGNELGYVGGVIGTIAYLTSGSLATTVVRNTYNTGAVIAEGNDCKYVGGAVGVVSAGNVNVTINNNYNIGKIQALGTGTLKLGSVIGSIGEDENPEGTFNVTNNYYLQGTAETDAGNSTVKTSEEMKTEEFVKLLGETVWQIRGGENSGYPVLIGLE